MKGARFMECKPLVVILGSTAVGKTEISLQLAESLEGEIVSADSRLLYRGMDIGTAKPSTAERSRAPHHLIDVADPDQVWSLGRYKLEAQQVIEEVQARGSLPFLVGGTGQYIRAVVQGWTIPAVKPQARLREALIAWSDEIGGDGLHQRLACLDPVAAEKIDYRNLRRTIRALEVIFCTGKRFSSQRRKAPPQYNALQLGLERPREELYACVDARIDGMLEAGLVAEVRNLLARGYNPALPTLSAIGYREIISHLLGEMTLDEAVREIRRNTRIFVRRQANWFKREDPNIHWYKVDAGTASEMSEKISKWLLDLYTPSTDLEIG